MSIQYSRGENLQSEVKRKHSRFGEVDLYTSPQILPVLESFAKYLKLTFHDFFEIYYSLSYVKFDFSTDPQSGHSLSDLIQSKISCLPQNKVFHTCNEVRHRRGEFGGKRLSKTNTTSGRPLFWVDGGGGGVVVF